MSVIASTDRGAIVTSVTSDILSGIGGDLAFKAPVKAATTANITLSGEQTVDGVALVTGNRVLVKNQTTTTENGIYVVDTGAWSRTKDFDGARDVVTGTAVFVISGTTNADTLWRVSTSGNPTPGSAMAFSAFPAGPTGPTGPTGPAGTLDYSLMNIETSADATADYIAMYDDSASTNDKITPANFYKTVTGLTAETAVDAADEILLYDTSTGTADKATIANVFKAVSTLTDTAITSSDIILFADATDSNNAKRDTVQGLFDAIALDEDNMASNSDTKFPTQQSVKAYVDAGDKVVQRVYASVTTSTSSGSIQIPADDTIPQNTEGLEAITLSITPTSATNRLRIRAVVNGANTASNETHVAALFQDTTVNALQVATAYEGIGNNVVSIPIQYEMVAGTTSSTTFKVRMGGESSTTYTLNGASGARLFGGVMAHTMVIEEIKA